MLTFEFLVLAIFIFYSQCVMLSTSPCIDCASSQPIQKLRYRSTWAFLRINGSRHSDDLFSEQGFMGCCDTTSANNSFHSTLFLTAPLVSTIGGHMGVLYSTAVSFVCMHRASCSLRIRSVLQPQDNILILEVGKPL